MRSWRRSASAATSIAIADYPRNAADACLQIAGITPDDVDVVAVGWDLPAHAARTDLSRLEPTVPGRPWRFDDTNDFLRAALGWDLTRAATGAGDGAPPPRPRRCRLLRFGV